MGSELLDSKKTSITDSSSSKGVTIDIQQKSITFYSIVLKNAIKETL